jgi:hypothetical protein
MPFAKTLVIRTATAKDSSPSSNRVEIEAIPTIVTASDRPDIRAQTRASRIIISIR